MNLVIVESPTKAKTIGKFLGDKYKIESSYGHVRDLPKSKLGVDVDKDFEPHYIVPVKSRKTITALKKLAAKSDKIILATDEDREGEAIAWHLAEALGLENSKFKIQNSKLPQVERIVFHEITERAIEDALKNPRGIDMHMVDAQQARRILDRLVGYQLSPFLWKKIARGLSAGRVQSVALRLIAEREEEIRAFKPEEYWSIDVLLKSGKKEFEVSLAKVDGEVLDKLGLKNEKDAKRIAKDLESSDCRVTSVESKETHKYPLPPFTTSTLQQAASQRLRMSVRQTMMFAQRLYENGHITYMRTDSVNLSRESLEAAAKTIGNEFGEKYLLSSPRIFKGKSRLAQEAHEAVRPTNPLITPEKIELEEAGEKKLYELIWRRFIASQMPEASFDSTHIEIAAKSSLSPISYQLSANGNVLRFDGFLKVWPQKFEEKELPEVSEGENLEVEKVNPAQHFTEPPARFNEASLIKRLEAEGIGRPSTYAPTISVIQTRNYVEKNEGRRLQPTELGELVNKVLREHFPVVVDIGFTAKMEEDLDKIAEGKEKWQKVIRNFYEPFAKHLGEKYEEVSKSDLVKEEKTEEVCEKCGKPMVIKTGRFGRFLACSGFPECKNAKSLVKNVGLKDENGIRMKCPKCGEGEVIRRRTRKGRFFYGCTRYPDCDYASWQKPR
ncbi:MAG: topoisomerase protein [Candidatus Jorgensenbacteria bacterium GW2011_GWA1_48_13]|uniref:DNA topoisomerase 1 n=2 Tax=Candidatus Joergenseniibacteriota TaxID=1752739 RepID=A0A0G1W8E7_9BACT|nr:MAG: topoisomerase protein [Candidatus Jorgensenbacteria bacterium GW2011_GWA1_48_13]KKU99303.1 MAG: topoisomerase protein [Candidatus Jorgensenbacteria bacterium GW2011_GWC1_48_8]KKW14983.1 MAG: topoisomerase protein [Candidatus Jorgensenbacteria bacterium GW2011_GWB1_50_10]